MKESKILGKIASKEVVKIDPKSVFSIQVISLPRNKKGQTYLWFCAWFSHTVLGMMVFYPWYFVDLVKGIMVML